MSSKTNVDKFNATIHLETSAEGSLKDGDHKRIRTMSHPKGTVPYIVAENDTIEKVALRFNLTPSELLHLNKLNTRFIFPGQKLYVPEPSSSNDTDNQEMLTKTPVSTVSPATSNHSIEDNVFSFHSDRRFSIEKLSTSAFTDLHSQQEIGPMVWSLSRPGHAERLIDNSTINSSPRTIQERLKTQREDNNKRLRALQKSLSNDINHELDDECLRRFIKVQVQLVTEDHHKVSGILLITPNAFMFDPDVLDPLVKQNGVTPYGLIVRMEHLAGITLYEDLTVYEQEANSRDEEKRKMFHSTSVKNCQNSSKNALVEKPDEQTYPVTPQPIQKLNEELCGELFNEKVRVLFDAASSVQRQLSESSFDNNDIFHLHRKHDDYLDDTSKLSIDIFQSIQNTENVNKTLDIPTIDKSNRNISQNDFHFNKLFNEIDNLLLQQKQIYLLPHRIVIPYYLCMKITIDSSDIPSLTDKIPKKSNMKNDHVDRNKKFDREYWFCIPEDKIDHIYSFFLRWTPDNEIDPSNDDQTQPSNVNKTDHQNASVPKGFLLLGEDDPGLNDDILLQNNSKEQKHKQEKEEKHYLSRQNTLLKDWEIISVDEIYRRINSTQQNNSHLRDLDFQGPTLLQSSILLNEEQSKQILIDLPARLQAHNWYLLFSTEIHGFSLAQLYRRSLEFDQDVPSLFIVKDVEQNVFGAFVPHQLIISEGFYGTGESFLFTFYPEFRVFNWSGDNSFYVKGDINSLGFGIGDGSYGLWVDSDLYHGRTSPSKTFHSEQLTSNEDFIIANIEVWTFTD